MDYYRGNPEALLAERRRKLTTARQLRKQENITLCQHPLPSPAEDSTRWAGKAILYSRRRLSRFDRDFLLFAMYSSVELRNRFRQLPRDLRDGNQDFSIRVWRALSWLERAESLDSGDVDGQFIFCWIGMNALYGRQSSAHRPWGDRESLGTFLSQVWRLDSHGLLHKLLGKRQGSVLNLIDNKYLNSRFWDGETAPAIRQVKQEVKSAILGYQKTNWLPILRLLFERLYVLRNQVFHGASTKGSRLNRRTLQISAAILMDLLQTFLQITIDAGVTEDWGNVTFPPRED
ncbi:MAG: hypothetical protein HBSAPP02_19040 [Phycisphaerae bacterium]|nr:MAG: hypothetical protein HBSAPP02_19040 [Phycisphaerae bacterium]